ncbi:MAG: tRNA preQ1(34) S-adenosylmethionine ribosyltransferase-isomerase QueA [Corallococcus sp.]|nr:tRNA preQ1(34) S-adenosylmethionine ribosyltransferase-isomerase QueA [Corallococcus sp.]MCM1359437.1 tRNA preQ1(34) S-adenosylmethionine ribosyltransferase-isomerase QueA [Corallococcus sp.]MCM1394751.1 tRNA preQ1(34) S-adenosylmethionine ribosyltransferase-isomerase QueA [Corallococcus sp.]
MKTSDFFYNLPEELIAQTPVEPRDSARLFVYDRAAKRVEHKHFCDIVDYLQKGDVLVVNNTKVLPARIYGHKELTGGKIEFLLLKRLDLTRWEVILKPGRIAKVGSVFAFSDKLKAKVESIGEDGSRIVEFIYEGVFEDILSELGEMPLPPYIKTKLNDKTRYNTVYSKVDGSAAAPTAGLHFTKELLQKVKDNGIEIAEVLLHVGLGTFRPVKVDDVESHHMHSEYYAVSKSAADTINKAKAEGRRVVCVGTTSVRTLESAADENGLLKECSGDTDIFIYPPYKFKVVDALITNFHLPESTLLMLVSALCSREEILELYKTAVKEKYRFFSFGDAMLIL